MHTYTILYSFNKLRFRFYCYIIAFAWLHRGVRGNVLAIRKKKESGGRYKHFLHKRPSSILFLCEMKYHMYNRRRKLIKLWNSETIDRPKWPEVRRNIYTYCFGLGCPSATNKEQNHKPRAITSRKYAWIFIIKFPAPKWK